MKQSGGRPLEPVPPRGRTGRPEDVDVSPERIRALVAGRVPHALLLDLAPGAATGEQILRQERLGE
ncbi:hypothetical protein KIN34_15160 [Cellulomonas sp. DKR-3]|uniref:Uncharacterized protein n=1 Tax=Cellulomonas fulva TaxID=2835530 RepID=A0ABS5U2S2_9CELL|nr:hypothetical protein [Cellulomonas fulva]MBT0995621.1 hypothetical protein [Cellulomonas fulva]